MDATLNFAPTFSNSTDSITFFNVHFYFDSESSEDKIQSFFESRQSNYQWAEHSWLPKPFKSQKNIFIKIQTVFASQLWLLVQWSECPKSGLVQFLDTPKWKVPFVQKPDAGLA